MTLARAAVIKNSLPLVYGFACVQCSQGPSSGVMYSRGLHSVVLASREIVHVQ